MAVPDTASPRTSSDGSAQIRIAKMVKACMGANDEYQVDLARLLNIDQTQVSKLLRGLRRLTVDELETIAAHYGRHPGAFYDGFDSTDAVRSGRGTSPLTSTDLRLLDGEGHDLDPGPVQLSFEFPALKLVK